MNRDFDLGDVLSITTGFLVSLRHMEGVYDILNFMTGDNLFTHQLPRAAKVCAPALLEQHPELATIDTDLDFSGSPDSALAWANSLRVQFGETLSVAPLAEWQSRNPLVELAEMAGDRPTIVAELP